MSILNQLNTAFSVGAKQKSLSLTEINKVIDAAKSVGCALPPDYLQLHQEASEMEFMVKKMGCIRFRNSAGVIEMNEDFMFSMKINAAFAIGDDEGGWAFLYMTGASGFGIYRVPFSDIDEEEAVFIAPSMKDLLISGTGINSLFSWL